MGKFTFLSKKGLRENNEDFYGHAGEEFFVVADGLGGHRAGEVASKIAVEKALNTYKILKEIETSISEANREIIQKIKGNTEYTGMATTVVTVALHSNEAIFGNVGDSRGYIQSENKLALKTQDDRDRMGYITSALGIDIDASPHTSKFSVEEGDLILLCTDGLTDYVREEVIEKILKSKKDLKDKAKGLLETSLQFGSTDNITICIIEI